MNNILRITGKIFQATLLTCPLYVWGRKGKKKKETDKAELEKWLKTLKGKEKEKAALYCAKMKSGKFILMLGSFCPLFWMSLLSGQRGGALLFNFSHSLIYIILGYFMYKRAKKSLYGMKMTNKR